MNIVHTPHRIALRPATTLVELLIFIAVLAIVSIAILPLLFASTETRLLQQTESLVEQNGAQALQTIARRVRASERILDPLPGASGSVLALQTASGGTNPTIIGVSSGSLALIMRTTKQALLPSQVVLEQFTVRNTSVSVTHPSVQVSFTLSSTTHLETSRVYRRTFQAMILLPPADHPVGNACGCLQPGCDAKNQYSWQICDGTCLTHTAALVCVP